VLVKQLASSVIESAPADYFAVFPNPSNLSSINNFKN